jgi:hypothetical protein
MKEDQRFTRAKQWAHRIFRHIQKAHRPPILPRRRRCQGRRPMKRTSLSACISATVIAAALVSVPVAVSAGQSQSWDKKIDNPQRFKVLADFNGDAVLDRETGLVWERKPDQLSLGSWAFIDEECLANFTGQRLGWRPPAIEELLSLMAPLQPDKLPAGHPFDLGPERRSIPRTFWAMSTNNVQPANNNFAFYANFEPGGSFSSDPKISGLHRFWCVRGGRGYDGNNVP